MQNTSSANNNSAALNSSKAMEVEDKRELNQAKFDPKLASMRQMIDLNGKFDLVCEERNSMID